MYARDAVIVCHGSQMPLCLRWSSKKNLKRSPLKLYRVRSKSDRPNLITVGCHLSTMAAELDLVAP
jgi:hypothetical protein